MNKQFNCIGLVGYPRQVEAFETHRAIYSWLKLQGYDVIVEDEVAQEIALGEIHVASLAELGRQADLVIVIGGDGNMLRVARVLANYDVYVIGVNRGTLGFLTEIAPETAFEQLTQVLAGDFVLDSRFLLQVQVKRDDKELYSVIALNEIVLHPGKVAHMIDFNVDIDGVRAFSQRSDGLIIATPTGSTGYALSAGGPILEPKLDALVIVPMFPLSLSARPLVINGNSVISLTSFDLNQSDVVITCDSQVSLPAKYGNTIVIKRSCAQLKLIHTAQYEYYNSLISKLGWSKTIIK